VGFNLHGDEGDQSGETWGHSLEGLIVDGFLDLSERSEDLAVGSLEEFGVVSGGESLGDDTSDLTEDIEDSSVFVVSGGPGLINGVPSVFS
jgi:hypothetical protein